jgi:hypothetical protein
MRTPPIDILQGFVDAYQRETTVAFFEFLVARAQEKPIAGLCRVSKPKQGSARWQYLSLTFTLDAPDEDTRATVDAALAEVAGEEFKAALGAVAEAVLAPQLSPAAENYVRQVDLMLEDGIDAGRQFIAERLLPVLRRVAHLSTGEIVWWNEPAEQKRAGGAVNGPGSFFRRFMNGLRRRFNRSAVRRG